eukprot:jgi/Astpho2/4560/Aster-00142
MFQFTSQEVLQQPEVSRQIDEAAAGGASGVLLSDVSGSGGAELYEAALKVKGLLRGRAVLLLADRTDIVGAAEADGVLLGSQGVPTVVARRTLPAGNNLIGRLVATADEAIKAAVEGAGLIVLQGASGAAPSSAEVAKAQKQRSGQGGVPVLAALNSVALTPEQEAGGQQHGAGAAAQVGSTRASLAVQDRPSLASQVYTRQREDLLEAEREFLSQVLDHLREATPQLEEISLLEDALKQLDELFLLVVVGEFNSGKSTVINALLGDRYLAEGVLPTTNEISVLKFAEQGTSSNGSGSSSDDEGVTMKDGFFERRLTAELLREINIVDTPGTNVILDRQQRLTEEFVPRSDLVLFVMSADRPFTESEVKFLRYIRQWGKKVVFVVNKVDILSNESELHEVTQFVRDNAQRALGVGSAQVLPVSSRRALEAKLECGSAGRGGVLDAQAESQLERDERWGASRFAGLEQFIYNYLTGGESAGERVRLKLQTPLYVTDALLEAAEKQMSEELEGAEQEQASIQQAPQLEQASIQQVLAQLLPQFRRDMQQDSTVQAGAAKRTVTAAAKRAGQFVDRTLQLSNLRTLSAYLLGSGTPPVAEKFETEVVGGSARALREAVEEHQQWLTSNCSSQVQRYSGREITAQALLCMCELVYATCMVGGNAQCRAGGKAFSLCFAKSNGFYALLHIQGGMLAAEYRSCERLHCSICPPVVAKLLPQVAALGDAAVDLPAGAATVGLFLTSILQSTWEDLLAVALAGLAGYVAVLGLPLRRGDIKGKLEKAAASLAEDVAVKLQQELDGGLSQCEQQVSSFMSPLEGLAAKEVARVQGNLRRVNEFRDRLENLRQAAGYVEASAVARHAFAGRSIAMRPAQTSRHAMRMPARAAQSTDEGVDVEKIVQDLQARWDRVEDKTSVAAYGVGAVVLLWFSSTIVSAVNAVPVLPKLLELVGLGYTAWFTYRYLLFKSSRQELLQDVEELKKKVTGAADDVKRDLKSDLNK